MLVCHCHTVSERAIRKAVRNGAVTRRAIARAQLAKAKAKPIPTSVELATS